jgi:hypothetical protein
MKMAWWAYSKVTQTNLFGFPERPVKQFQAGRETKKEGEHNAPPLPVINPPPIKKGERI